MKSVRSRLTILLCILVLVSAAVTLVVSILLMDGTLFPRKISSYFLLGFSLRDILMFVLAIMALIVLVAVTSRSTTNPIRDLNHAAQEIARGNYDVTVDIKDNVEEFGELERNFNLMAAELRSNEYLKKDFISNVSHELKTPLSILRGYSQLLTKGGLSEEEQREYAGYIANETEELVNLIDNMLRLSRIDNQKIRPKSEPFALGEQLRQAILQLEPKWSAAGLLLDADIPDIDYAGDSELLFHVWTNLIGNAIKFSRPGGIIVVALQPERTRIMVSVADNGIGMDQDTAARIFDQFYQGDTAHKRDGSGLGLTLCRRIVELHGGTITVETSPGTGSLFRVILPTGE